MQFTAINWHFHIQYFHHDESYYVVELLDRSAIPNWPMQPQAVVQATLMQPLTFRLPLGLDLALEVTKIRTEMASEHMSVHLMSHPKILHTSPRSHDSSPKSSTASTLSLMSIEYPRFLSFSLHLSLDA